MMMKIITVVVVVVVFSAAMLLAVERPCIADNQCKRDECCALKLTGEGKICREISENVGEACQGLYFCQGCARNLTCVPLSIGQPDSNVQQDKLPQSCGHPANSTCQNVTIPSLDVVQPAVIMPVEIMP